MEFYLLSKCERQFLFRKYVQSGLSFEEANKKVSDFNIQLFELRERLKSKNKTKKDIDKKFKEKFEELCQKLEP